MQAIKYLYTNAISRNLSILKAQEIISNVYLKGFSLETIDWHIMMSVPESHHEEGHLCSFNSSGDQYQQHKERQEVFTGGFTRPTGGNGRHNHLYQCTIISLPECHHEQGHLCSCNSGGNQYQQH